MKKNENRDSIASIGEIESTYKYASKVEDGNND